MCDTMPEFTSKVMQDIKNIAPQKEGVRDAKYFLWRYERSCSKSSGLF